MMKVRELVRVSVPHSHRVPLFDDAGNPAGCEWITDPWTEEEVIVEVNPEGIAKAYGPRACRSSGGRCRLLQGLVVVTAEPAGGS